MTQNFLTKISKETILNALYNDDTAIASVAKKIDVEFSELKEYLYSLILMPTKVYIDGGSRNNPGDAGIGIVIETSIIKKGYYYFLGKATNNEAEYQALIHALKILVVDCEKTILIYSDSQLICNQINGIYKVKNESMSLLYNQAMALMGKFYKLSLLYISRENNREADKLANIAMDLKENGEIELAVARPLNDYS